MPARLISPADLSRHNTLRLPCEAAALWLCSDADAILEALEGCASSGLHPLPLGEGSNVILPPRLPRAVLRSADRSVRRLADRAGQYRVRVGAGKPWHDLVCELLDARLYGLENLALIPGTTGAAPVQNIGAYGVELCDVLEAVHGVDLLSGERRSLGRDECAFAYRDSVFKHALADRFMITAVDFTLPMAAQPNVSYPGLARRLEALGAAPAPQSIFDAVVSLRRERLPDPAAMPNAGSFFKNPLLSAGQADALRDAYPELPLYAAGPQRFKASAAWMIERCGFRGRRHGSAGVSEKHALVLVNRGGDRASLLELAAEIRSAVAARFDCDLELEPTVIDGEAA